MKDPGEGRDAYRAFGQKPHSALRRPPRHHELWSFGGHRRKSGCCNRCCNDRGLNSRTLNLCLSYVICILETNKATFNLSFRLGVSNWHRGPSPQTFLTSESRDLGPRRRRGNPHLFFFFNFTFSTSGGSGTWSCGLTSPPA